MWQLSRGRSPLVPLPLLSTPRLGGPAVVTTRLNSLLALCACVTALGHLSRSDSHLGAFCLIHRIHTLIPRAPLSHARGLLLDCHIAALHLMFVSLFLSSSYQQLLQVSTTSFHLHTFRFTILDRPIDNHPTIPQPHHRHSATAPSHHQPHNSINRVPR